MSPPPPLMRFSRDSMRRFLDDDAPSPSPAIDGSTRDDSRVAAPGGVGRTVEKMRESRLSRDSLPNQIFMKFLPVDGNRSWHWQKPQNCPWLKYRVVWFLERFRLHGEPFMRSMGENRPPFSSSLGRFSRTKTPTFLPEDRTAIHEKKVSRSLHPGRALAMAPPVYEPDEAGEAPTARLGKRLGEDS